MRTGDKFRFVCDPEHVEKMLKVIAHNMGRVEERYENGDGIYFTVIKRKPYE
jgi:hypothetical protein